MRTDLIDEVHELMCAKRIWFNDSTPVWVQRHCSCSDAFAPVIFISKAATWPTYGWDLERFECSDNVVANAACVWNLRIRTDPDPLVDTLTEVLYELTEEVAIDLWTGFGSVD